MDIRFEEVVRCEEDAQLIMQWRNDPVALAVSYHSAPKEWPAFWAEFIADYFLEPDLPAYFAVGGGRRVGLVRFQSYRNSPFHGRTVTVGINMDPSVRGRGLGPRIIELATSDVFGRGVRYVVAEIKRHNLRSIRAFEKAGYVHYDAMEKDIPDLPELVPIVRYVKSNEPAG
jgi:RimJ/RimL family protein N-acetyltransferase